MTKEMFEEAVGYEVEGNVFVNYILPMYESIHNPKRLYLVDEEYYVYEFASLFKKNAFRKIDLDFKARLSDVQLDVDERIRDLKYNREVGENEISRINNEISALAEEYAERYVKGSKPMFLKDEGCVFPYLIDFIRDGEIVEQIEIYKD